MNRFATLSPPRARGCALAAAVLIGLALLPGGGEAQPAKTVCISVLQPPSLGAFRVHAPRALVREAGKSTLFVTHSVDEAITLGDRSLVFARPGRVVQTLAVPAGIDGGERLALREKAMAALADARSTSPHP